VRNVLERGEWKFDLVLVNPQHVRALQGEKSDDKNCRRLENTIYSPFFTGDNALDSTEGKVLTGANSTEATSEFELQTEALRTQPQSTR